MIAELVCVISIYGRADRCSYALSRILEFILDFVPPVEV